MLCFRQECKDTSTPTSSTSNAVAVQQESLPMTLTATAAVAVQKGCHCEPDSKEIGVSRFYKQKANKPHMVQHPQPEGLPDGSDRSAPNLSAQPAAGTFQLNTSSDSAANYPEPDQPDDSFNELIRSIASAPNLTTQPAAVTLQPGCPLDCSDSTELNLITQPAALQPESLPDLTTQPDAEIFKSATGNDTPANYPEADQLDNSFEELLASIAPDTNDCYVADSTVLEENKITVIFEHSGVPAISTCNQRGEIGEICLMNDFQTVQDLLVHLGASVEQITQQQLEVADGSSQQLEQPESSERRLTRKRSRNEGEWAKNKRKKFRQAGKAYVDSRGKQKECRKPNCRRSCFGKCNFKCSEKINPEWQKALFNSFWQLSDIEKQHFYAKTTEQVQVCNQEIKTSRPASSADPAIAEGLTTRNTDDDSQMLVENQDTTVRNSATQTESRKKWSIKYFLPSDNNQNIRVCKKFYLATRDVSQRRISYFHETKQACGLPRPRMWGKHVARAASTTPDPLRDSIRKHISSIPRIDSHYCRARTAKEYIDGSLNIKQLYEHYVTERQQNGADIAKEWMYRDVFNHDFNIAFQRPKSDRCDECEAFKMNQNCSHDEISKHNKHVQSKISTKQQRDSDRQITSNEVAVICFDLENVLSLPRAEISSFFYKRKLNVYNLTVHVAKASERKVYCCIWHEGIAGRGANHLSSALIKALTRIIHEDSEIHHIILWSDSCVPQNRNSIMSTALFDFMIKHPSVITTEQKFCEPGHSCIQEVDNVHSQIEKRLRTLEVFSPVTLIRALLSTNKRSPFTVIQLTTEDFQDFQHTAKQMNFHSLPYSKVKHIVYHKSSAGNNSSECENSSTDITVEYKIDFEQTEFNSAAVVYARSTRQEPKTSVESRSWPQIRRCPPSSALSVDKQRDLKDMLKFMPQTDAEFYNTLFSATSEDNAGDSDAGMSSAKTRAGRKRPLSSATSNTNITGMSSAKKRRAGRKDCFR